MKKYIANAQQMFAIIIYDPHNRPLKQILLSSRYQEGSGHTEVSDLVKMPSHPCHSFFWSHSFWSVFKRKDHFSSMGRPGPRLWFPGKPRSRLQVAGWLSHPGVVPNYKWKAVPCSSICLYSSFHLLRLLGVCVGLGAWRWSRCGHILSSSK